MPRLVHAAPSYRRHQSGQAVVTLDGKDRYLGRYGSPESRLAYANLIARWEANGRRPLESERSDITVSELCAQYLAFAKRYHRNADAKNQGLHGLKRAIRYLRLAQGAAAVSEVGPLALKAIREQMIADDLSRGYINGLIAKIVHIFRWGVGEELVPADTHRALSVVGGLRRGRSEARETTPVLPVEDAIVDATLPHLPAVVADMVRLQRLTGMRPGELCILRPGDVERSGDVWRYRPSHHKTEHHGHQRMIPIGPAAQQVLLPYLDRDPAMYCFRPRDSEAKRRAAAHAQRRTPLSCGNKPGSNRRRRPRRNPGQYYSVDSYRRAIRRAAAKAFVPPAEVAHDKLALAVWKRQYYWSPNQLRHALATKVRQQFGLEAAQTVLGHSRADVTQIYAERDAALALSVARQVG